MGEKPTFDELYRTELDFLWRQMRRFGVPDGDVEDATQEVFLIAHRKWASFDPERAKPRSWLWGIARGVAANRRRSLKGKEVTERVTPLPAPGGTAHEVEARERLLMVDACLAELGAKQREIFEFVEIEGMTVPEVSAITGVNPNTLSTRLRQARRAFATKFASLRQSGGEQ